MSDTDDTTDAEEAAIAADTGAPAGMPSMLWNKIPPKMRGLMSVMQQEDGVAKMLQRPVYGAGEDGEPVTSQAEVVADMFNIMRLDVKALGDAAGVDIGVDRMTPEAASHLLQGLVKGESFELVEKFNQLEDKREDILLALTDEETVEKHRDVKESVLYSEVDNDGDVE